MCFLSQLLSKVTVTSCSYLHQMFNVSALLLNDANVTCVATEGVLFSFVALNITDISQGSVSTCLRCSQNCSDSIITNFLLILKVKKSEK